MPTQPNKPLPMLSAGATSLPVLQGFKISLLLKLQDIKATDRTTSLLEFCIRQAQDKSSTLPQMPSQLESVKPAAKLQVTAVDTLVSEMTSGIKQAKEHVAKAAEGTGAAAEAEVRRRGQLCTVHSMCLSSACLGL